ncbi:MAG: DNA glycosylase [Tissierellia bacterium]|nr:DNA glycosylase [Tissierellia bacterium]
MNRFIYKEKKELDLTEKDGYLLLRCDSFNPKDIFECGQCFNFNKEEDGSYTAVFMRKIINVKKENEDIIIKNITKDEFYEYFYDYFDLGNDYEKIKKDISTDETLKESVKYGDGIRILNQEVFETIISFIISANNQIPRIKKAVRIISERYGDYIGDFNGVSYYSFPRPEVLAKANPKDLREYAKVGFRDQRIVETSKIIADGFIDFDKEINSTGQILRIKLMELPGVGPKVSDCIMLFAYHKRETFPVDVWIKRVMEYLFIKKEVPKKYISDYANELFGENAGYVQQYLFYYGRENNIGK